MPTSAINNSSTHKLISYVEVDNALAKPITKMNFDPPKLEGGVGSGLPILQQLKVHIVNQRILAEIIEGKHKALPADKLAILDLRTKSESKKQIKGAKHIPFAESANEPTITTAIKEGYTNKGLVYSVLKDPNVSHIVVHCALGVSRSVNFVWKLSELKSQYPDIQGKKICILPGGFTAYEQDTVVKATIVAWA